MAGLQAHTPHPEQITLHQQSRQLEICYDNGVAHRLDWELLRVLSPSAEVRGHGGDTPKLVTGKRQVQLTEIEPIGHYAIRLQFDDGHGSGLYSWDYLYDLGQNAAQHWAHYLQRLAHEGGSREA